MTALPDWFFGPPEGWHADDLDRLPPDAPRHIELIDGGLVVTTPRKSFHSQVTTSLHFVLATNVVDELAVHREMSIRIDDWQRPEPDLLVLDRSAMADAERTWYKPDVVHLVIEVESPESQARDRLRKPQIYAQGGIKYFWRVENNQGRAAVFTYELDAATRSYVPTGVYHETLKVSRPFPVEIQVDTLHEFRPFTLA